jgi:hypothetical protein
MLRQFARTATAAIIVGLSAVASAADTVVVITSHEVADFAAWKKGFDAGKANRDKAGMKERYIIRDAEKPNLVTIVLESESLENARQFVSAVNERIKKNANIISVPDVRIGTTGTR